MQAAPQTDLSGPASLILAAFVMVAAIFLAWRQTVDRLRRSGQLDPFDRRYFLMQDVRRLTGTVVLIVMAVAIAFGGSMPTKIDNKANLRFVQLWSGVTFLIVALLVLAMLDWISTRLYARRLRAKLVREGLSIVEAELRIRMAIKRRGSIGLNGNGPATAGDHG